MKIIKVIFFIALFPNLAFSQTEEFSLNYSPMSVYKLGHQVEEGVTENRHSVLGAITFDYYHYMNDRLKLGLSFMFDQEHSEGTVNYGYITEYEKTNSVFLIAPQIDFEYINNKKFKLSSSLSLGYAFSKHEATKGLNLNEGMRDVTGHLNLISFRWGVNNGLCGYMGIGYKGFLGLGYFVRL
jgi:hypothetical protein